MQHTNHICLTAELYILPGFENEVLAAAETLWIATRKEKGCQAFVFNTKRDAPNEIIFFAEFKSQADLDAHIGFEHTLSFTRFLKGKVVGDGPTLTFLDQYQD